MIPTVVCMAPIPCRDFLLSVVLGFEVRSLGQVYNMRVVCVSGRRMASHKGVGRSPPPEFRRIHGQGASVEAVPQTSDLLLMEPEDK